MNATDRIDRVTQQCSDLRDILGMLEEVGSGGASAAAGVTNHRAVYVGLAALSRVLQERVEAVKADALAIYAERR